LLVDYPLELPDVIVFVCERKVHCCVGEIGKKLTSVSEIIKEERQRFLEDYEDLKQKNNRVITTKSLIRRLY